MRILAISLCLLALASLPGSAQLTTLEAGGKGGGGAPVVPCSGADYMLNFANTCDTVYQHTIIP